MRKSSLSVLLHTVLVRLDVRWKIRSLGAVFATEGEGVEVDKGEREEGGVGGVGEGGEREAEGREVERERGEREREREVQQWQNATPNAERYSLSDNCINPGRCQVLGSVDFQSLENGCRLEAEERGSGKRRCMRVGLPRGLHGQTAWWRRSTYICPNHYSPLRRASSRFPPPIHGEPRGMSAQEWYMHVWLENAGLESAGTLEIFL